MLWISELVIVCISSWHITQKVLWIKASGWSIDPCEQWKGQIWWPGGRRRPHFVTLSGHMSFSRSLFSSLVILMFLQPGMSSARWCLVCTAGHAAPDRDVQHHPSILLIPRTALTLTEITTIFQAIALIVRRRFSFLTKATENELMFPVENTNQALNPEESRERQNYARNLP